METILLIQGLSSGSDGLIMSSSSSSSSEADAQHTAQSSTRTYVRRDRVAAEDTLMSDYFVDDPKYNEDIFRDRFRMSKRLFLKIVHDVSERFEFFQEGYDGRKKKSFTPIQKITSAVKQLATGNPPDEYDEYLAMSDRTSRECLEFFLHGNYYFIRR